MTTLFAGLAMIAIILLLLDQRLSVERHSGERE